MTSMTTPAPLAEFLPASPSGAGDTAGLRTMLGEAALPRTADFAALLQDAGLAAPPLVVAEVPRSPEETTVDPRAEEGTTASALDGILFMAVVQSPVLVNATVPGAATGGHAATPSQGRIDGAVVDKRMRADAKLTAASADPAATANQAESIANEGLAAGFVAAPAGNEDKFAAATDAKRDATLAERSQRPALELANIASSNAQPSAQRAVPDAGVDNSDSRTVSAKGVEPTASLSASQSTTALPPVTVTIDTPVHDASWRHEAAARMASLVTRGIEHAEVRVTPPDLGPVELRIDVRGGEATLAIVATQPTTRDALEQALPMLRDMLAQQGLSLGQATVADGRAESQSGGNGSSSRGDTFGSNAPLDDSMASHPVRATVARGLIDVFA